MKRVVVTGLGMVTPLGLRRRGDLAPADRRQRSAPARVENFDVSDLACQIAAQVPRGDGAETPSIPTTGWSRRNSASVDDFIVYAMSAATQALAGRRLGAQDLRGGDRDRRADRLGHRRPRRHLRRLDHPARDGAAPHFAVLHSRPADQSRQRPCLDRPQAQGPEPRGGHRLLDRRACDRRRRAADRARRRQCDGGGRRGIGGQSPCACRLLPPAARSRPASTIGRSRPRAPTTATATVSSWARAPAASCSRNSSTPRRAARESMPN